MHDEPPDRWNQLLGAAKQAGATRPAASTGSAPEPFVARVRTMRAGLWALAKAIFWRRWSLLAALVALALYLVCHLLLKPDAPRSIPTPPPPNPLSR